MTKHTSGNNTLSRGAYGIENAHTVLRGTLRYKGYADAMQTLFETGLFSQNKMNLAGFTWVNNKHTLLFIILLYTTRALWHYIILYPMIYVTHSPLRKS